MERQVSQALNAFTQRYVELWQRETGHPPASDELYGVASPCIVATQESQVHWLPQAPVCLRGWMALSERWRFNCTRMRTSFHQPVRR